MLGGGGGSSIIYSGILPKTINNILKGLKYLNRGELSINDYPIIIQYKSVKATFSVHKLIPQNAQMTTLYTNWSLYITFTMIYYIRHEYFVKVSRHILH